MSTGAMMRTMAAVAEGSAGPWSPTSSPWPERTPPGDRQGDSDIPLPHCWPAFLRGCVAPGRPTARFKAAFYAMAFDPACKLYQ